MKIIKLVLKNTLRHKLRSLLTAIGIAVAIFAFALLRTVIDAYFVGVEASSDTRLVTQNAVSLTFSLPLSYKEKIAKIPGVENICSGFWFGGTYIDQKNFFARFAIDPEPFLELYPEYVLPESERESFIKERNSCIVGRKLANKYGWEVGDTFRLIGDIFPGDWDFVVRGIYDGAIRAADETQMFFHWKYIDERLNQTSPGRSGQAGWYYIGISSPELAGEISEAIDSMFDNSVAETKTETEKQFQLSFVSMVSTIITAIRVISVVVIAIILLVLANTMAMTARERISEYAVLKTLGFRPKHLVGLIFGESSLIAIFGGILGILITLWMVPAFYGVLKQFNMEGFFPVFEISKTTFVFCAIAALAVGIIAALFPTLKAVQMKISDGLRQIG
ncbi:FtsX-like permease family protein [candidate division KSB1 bacterium]|nr:FtsX-like permease family protein [candidate division KSB1 bacterium]MCH8981666.1 FtsX-like permease family protein [candidate division KSB1 bacterium]